MGASRRYVDLTLIEAMPLGAIGEDRSDQFLSLASVRRELSTYWSLDSICRSAAAAPRG